MMLAHYHGQVWNASEFARSFGVSHPTVRRYLDALVATFMVRELPAWHENLGKRQVKSPKVYIRDSGLLHALLGVGAARDRVASQGGSVLGGIRVGGGPISASRLGRGVLLLADAHGRGTRSARGARRTEGGIRVQALECAETYRLHARGSGEPAAEEPGRRARRATQLPDGGQNAGGRPAGSWRTCSL
jgi:hypothetical protein